VGYAALIEKMRMRTKFWSENLMGRDHSENLSVDGKIILECTLGEYGGKLTIGCIRLRIGTSGGLLRIW